MNNLDKLKKLWDDSKRHAESMPGRYAYQQAIENGINFGSGNPNWGTTAGNTEITISSGAMQFNVPTGKVFSYQINASEVFRVAAGGITRIGGTASAGLGVPILVASPATATGLIAANTNFINFTPPATAGDYKFEWAVDTTTATTDNFTVVVTWKNSAGTARSQNSGGFDKAGTSLVAGAITNTIGAGNYYGSIVVNIDNSATALTLSTAGTFTTVTYNLTARLYQI